MRKSATNRLRIVRLDKCYGVRFEAGPTRTRVLELFETDTLPLPFTLKEDPDRVASKLLSTALVRWILKGAKEMTEDPGASTQERKAW